jgi:hypothetical protein
MSTSILADPNSNLNPNPNINPNPNPNLNPNLNLNPIPNINPNLNPKPNPNLNLNIKEWENAVKKTTHTHKKKQIKKTKLSLQLFLMANFDRVNGPIDMRVWKGRRFENILKS